VIQDLRGRTAVITGAGSGIGRGMATVFAAEGMQVAVCDIRAEALDETVAAVKAHGVRALPVQMDVSDSASVQQAAAQIAAAFGDIHVLCNNAGIAMHGTPVAQLTAEDWDWVIGVNIRGVINGVQHFLPLLQRHGAPAHIVNTASIGGFQVNPGFRTGPYSMTKYAVVALSEALEQELAGRNVGISVLAPAAVATGIFRSARARPERLGSGQDNPAQLALEDLIREGWNPERVGRRVVHAIRHGEFYIFTHVAMQIPVEQRHARLQQAFAAAALWAASNPA
jgi:NAD(P)-dependent dehydrogenase (short-subunit alcohol dehydrogenase family)